MNKLILSVLTVISFSNIYGQEMKMPNDAKADASVSHDGHATMNMSGMSDSGAKGSQQITIQPEDAEYYPVDMASMGVGPFGLLLVDQLEYRAHDGDDFLRWDAEGWYGGDINRFWVKTEGEQTLQGPDAGTAQVHGYYSRLVSPFWEAQAGIRFDTNWGSSNNSDLLFGAVGLQGRAPYNFEVTPVLFLSENGDLSARLTASKDYRITQRLIAQPRFESEISAQNVPEFGIGSGFNYVELGLRLRYEIRREFAPYVGINWERKLGRSADFSRADGEDPSLLSVVAGLRVWF